MVRQIRALLRTLLFALLASALLPALPAAAGNKLLLIVGGADKHIYLPVTLAQTLGYFREQGLEVQIESENSGVDANDALLSGAADGVVGAYDHTIDLQARGKSIKAIVLFTSVPGEVELVATRAAQRIVSPAQLVGANVGVTGLGSSTSFLTRYLVAQQKLNPAGLRLIPVGAGQPFIDAMRSGRIDAGMTTEPTASRLINAGGARVLVDLRTPEATRQALGGLYPFASLYVRNDWLLTHQGDAQRLAAALVKALRYIHGHSAAEIAAHVPEAFFAGQKDIYLQSLAASKPMFTSDGAMPPDGPATVLKVLSSVNSHVRGKRIDLSQTYTSEYVDAAR